MLVELTSDELGIINNTRNEVCNGLLGDDTPVVVCPVES